MSRKSLRWIGLCSLAALQVACATGSSALRPPSVELASLSVVQGLASSQRFRVSLTLTNPNAEPTPVDDLKFSVRLAGEGLLAGAAPGPLVLPPGGHETLEVEVAGDTISSLSRLRALAQGPQSVLPYELLGNLTMSRRTFPFNSSGDIPLVTTDR